MAASLSWLRSPRGFHRHKQEWQAGRVRSLGEPYSRELPTGLRREKISVSRADMAGRRNTGADAKHELITHELSVVFADHSRRGNKTGIGDVGASCPLPNVAHPLLGCALH